MSPSSSPEPGAEHDHHGNSVAAWVGVSIIMVGAAVIALAVALPSWPLAWGGIVLVVAGPVVGKILAGLGFGVAGRH